MKYIKTFEQFINETTKTIRTKKDFEADIKETQEELKKNGERVSLAQAKKIVLSTYKDNNIVVEGLDLDEIFLNEGNTEAAEEEILSKLYNGIMNDPSVKRYSHNWKEVIAIIEKKIKNIEISRYEFTDLLLLDAISITSDKKLKSQLEAMARELKINIDTIRRK